MTLPPRNYTLVHEDGRLHKRDNFTPMSFGMQRIHNNAGPEPVWVQTQNARWMQGTTEVVASVLQQATVRALAQADTAAYATCLAVIMREPLLNTTTSMTGGELCIPHYMVLDIAYYQLNQTTKRIVMATLVFDEYSELPFEPSDSDYEYTLDVSYHPLDYIELIVWFAFEEKVFLIIFFRSVA